MDNTNFDALCEGATPGEAKRLRKLLAEWCDGDEESFPVQLALLTRAQWRAAAAVPRPVNQSREPLGRKLAENRQQTAALIKGLSDTADAKGAALETIIAQHSETAKKAVSEIPAPP